MSTLFVDVDDTLILYDDDLPRDPVLGHSIPNEPLVKRIQAWDGPVVVWSAGGRDYACAVGDYVLGALSFTALEKDRRAYAFVQPGDVVVDNDPIPGRTHEPMDVFSAKSEAG